MEKEIIMVMLGIMMIGLVSSMYAGESKTFEINLTDPVYIVTENSSNLEGLNITFENGNITISTVINYKPDNFTLIFFDNTTEVEKIVYKKGGSRTKYIDKNITQNQTIYVPIYINNTEIINNSNETICEYIPTEEKTILIKIKDIFKNIIDFLIFWK